MSLKPYLVYKESGVDWIGQVPEHWGLQSLKSILAERIEKNDPIKTNNILSLTIDRGVIPYAERGGGGNKSKEDITGYKLAYPNDIVLNSMNVVVGAVGLSKYFGAVSPVYYMLYPRKNEDKVEYFSNIFQSETFQKSLLGLGNGILMKESTSSNKLNTIRMRIPMGKLNSQVLPYPEKSEQEEIVKFLVVETNKLDTLIAKQEHLIELLQEKRQAIISHAVTKGLNPDAQMKDSGVEWLGMVPEHWSVTRLKYVGVAIIGLTYDPSEVADEGIGTLVLRSSNVQNGNIVFDDNVYVTKFISEKLTTKIGDILICSRNGSRALIGKNAMIDAKSAGVTFGAFMTIFRSQLNSYLTWVFNSQLFYYQSSSFLTSTINQLTTGNLYGFEILLPPEEEQMLIIEHLKYKTLKIDNLIAKAKLSIDLAKEHRTALISAAVTGKIDVRDHVKDLEVA